MTVAQELCRLTGFKLFYSHVIADVLTPFFPFGTVPFARLTEAWRLTFLQEAAEAKLHLVMTVAWRFDVPNDESVIRNWLRPYIERGRVLCVELNAPLSIRLERNRSENRLSQKNQYWVTDDYLKETDVAHDYVSNGAFPLDVPHLYLETERLSADATARRIIEEFDLPGSAALR